MTRNPRLAVAAGIVAYEPDATLISGLIASVLGQVDLVLVYRNSGVPPAVARLAQEHPGHLVLLGDECNRGLGVAHNRTIEAAMANGIERIVLFDQDSSPSEEL